MSNAIDCIIIDEDEFVIIESTFNQMLNVIAYNTPDHRVAILWASEEINKLSHILGKEKIWYFIN